jgi:diguanylate cyclase (GGDEF)-like protein
MTGLPNMRAFGVALRRERARADRDGRPFSVMMIDTDNLKEVNDKLGHDVGNQLIIQIVDAIRRTLRSSDFMARYGGDEFVMLLPGTDAERTNEAAERIRQAIANTTFDAAGERVSSTVSIGHATYPDVAGDVESLMLRADQAMYMSKKAGRNSVTAYRKEAG